MTLYRPIASSPSKLKKVIKSLLLVGALLLMFFLAVNQIILLFNRGKIEKSFSKNKPFGILLNLTDKKKSLFISVVTFYPATSRIGFFTFFSNSKISKNNSVLSHEAFLNVSDVQDELEDFIDVEIPYYLTVTLEDVKSIVNLSEGLPYFLYGPRVTGDENLPHRRFLLNGDLAIRLFANKSDNGFIDTKINNRSYSFLLNYWRLRQKKWDLIQANEVFKLIAKIPETNIPIKDQFFLLRTLVEESAWLPMFMEIPVKHLDDAYVIDKQAANLLMKRFKQKLIDKKSPFFDKQPSIEIKNGTNIPRLASKYRKNLSRKGLQVLEFSNADHSNYSKSILIDVSGNPFFLDNAARLLNSQLVFHDVDRSKFTDLILIVGKDYNELNTE